MVSPTEIKQQIAQREQQFQQARQQLAQTSTRIPVSQRQLLSQTLIGRARLKAAELTRRKQISTARQQLSQQEAAFKKQAAPIRSQIQQFEADRSAINLAKKRIKQGRTGINTKDLNRLPSSSRNLFKKIMSEAQSRAAGLTGVVERLGEAAGVSSTRIAEDIERRGIRLEDIGELSQSLISESDKQLQQIQSKIEAQTAELDLPPFQVSQIPGTSDFERLITAPGPLEEAIGRTFEGIPLVSTPEGVKPAFEPVSIPDFQAPDIDISERREFAKTLGKIAPLISGPPQIPLEVTVEAVKELSKREIEAARRIKRKIIEPTIEGVKGAVEFIAPTVQKVAPIISGPPQVTIPQVIEVVSPTIGVVAPTLKRSIKAGIESEKEFFSNIKTNIISPITEEIKRTGLAKTFEEALPLVKARVGLKVGDVFLGDIKKAHKIEQEKLEPTAERIVDDINLLSTITDPDKQQELITKLENQGVIFEPGKDPETGEDILNIKNPEWFKQLRPGFEKKDAPETFSSFFFRKLDQGIEENVSDIYQRAVFVGPTLLEPGKPVVISPEAAFVGKTTAIGTRVAAFAIPGIREGIIFGGTSEAILRGPKGFIQFAKEEPLEVGIAAVGAGIGAFKAVKFLKEPIIIKGAIPKPIIASADVIQPIQIGGQRIDKGRFVLISFTPAREATVISRFGKLIGKTPKIIQISKPATRVAFTPAALTIKNGQILEPAFFVTARAGKTAPKFVTVFGLAGKQAPTTIKSFNKLSAIERAQWKALVEQSLGRPVPAKFVPKFIKENLIKTKGGVVSEKLFRLTPSRAEVRSFKSGTGTARQEVVTTAEKIALPEGAEIQIFKTKSAFKDVTKPFARATGDIPVVSGVTIVGKPQVIKPEDIFGPFQVGEGISPVAGVPGVIPKLAPQITKTQQAIIALKKTEVAAAKVITKPPRISLPKPTPSPAIVEVPGAVPGVTIASKFFGPQPALEETFIIPGPGAKVGKFGKGVVVEARTTAGTSPVFLKTPDVKIIDETRIKIGTKEVQIPIAAQQPIQELENIQIQKSVQIPKFVQPTVLTQPTITKQAQIPIQVPKVAQVSVLKVPQVQIPRAPTKPVTPRTPVTKIPKPIVFIPGDGVSAPKVVRKKRPKVKKPLFTPQVKRKGKWVGLGKFKNPKRAAAVGKKDALKTPAASVRLLKNGKVVPLKTSKLFRRSKVHPGVIVQKKTKRIQSPGEKREISLIGSRAAKAKRVKAPKPKSMFKLKPTKKKKSSKSKKQKKVKKTKKKTKKGKRKK